MITVNVLEFRERASKLVRFIMRTGENVLITDAGEVVAQLVSAKHARNRPWTTLDNLAAQIKPAPKVGDND